MNIIALKTSHFIKIFPFDINQTLPRYTLLKPVEIAKTNTKIYIYIYTRIFENGTARLRCPSGVSRALFCRSETISKVGNIKIMSASSPFFFSPLSPPFSFLSRVVSRLMGVQKTQFRCRSGQNGQIFRSHLFKNPGRYIYIYIYIYIYMNNKIKPKLGFSP